MKIEKALADDFDTPKALTSLEDLIRITNAQLSKKLVTEVRGILRACN